MIDLQQLRSFAEVAERGTVAAAAAAQQFTPPAVSQHVSKLEAELGVPLFDRIGRRLRLTDSGTALLPIALQMLDLESSAREAVTSRPNAPHCVIAGFASAISTLVVPRLAELTEITTLEVVEGEDADALRDLSLGEVDLVLTQEYEGLPSKRDDRFDFVPLLTDRLRLVLPADMEPTTTVDELGATNWLLNGRDTRCAAATINILQAHQIDPSISGVIGDNDTLLALVAAGHGVTIVPELLLGPDRSDITVAEQAVGRSRTIFVVCRSVTRSDVTPIIEILDRSYQPSSGTYWSGTSAQPTSTPRSAAS